MRWQQVITIGFLLIQLSIAGSYEQRFGKSLTASGSFPFAAAHHGDHGDNHEHHHEHHESHHQAHTDLESRFSRQGVEEGNEVPDLGQVAQAGERCVEKVMMIEETTYDDQIVCHHSYSTKCHVTYITDYEAVQMEMCEDIFEKHCVIEYKKRAEDEEVEICNEVFDRNCNEPGPEVCEPVFESECRTSYHVHEVEEDKPNCVIMQVEKCKDVTIGYSTERKCDKWPKQVCNVTTEVSKRVTPDTKCEKKQRQVCGPGPCPMRKSPVPQCRTTIETVIYDDPVEDCSLNPKKDCKFVTKRIPLLKPREECVDIPKEVCVRAKVNPRKTKRPIIKKWCYSPERSDEIDLDNNDNTDTDDAENDTTLKPLEEDNDDAEETSAAPVRRG